MSAGVPIKPPVKPADLDNSRTHFKTVSHPGAVFETMASFLKTAHTNIYIFVKALTHRFKYRSIYSLYSMYVVCILSKYVHYKKKFEEGGYFIIKTEFSLYFIALYMCESFLNVSVFPMKHRSI